MRRNSPKARQLWDKWTQESAFQDTKADIGAGKQSQLVQKLGLFIANDGLVRCRTRLLNADVDEDVKQPKLLPRHHSYTRLIIIDSHHSNLHSGDTVTHSC